MCILPKYLCEDTFGFIGYGYTLFQRNAAHTRLKAALSVSVHRKIFMVLLTNSCKYGTLPGWISLTQWSRVNVIIIIFIIK
jgi:hypothetical protein